MKLSVIFFSILTGLYLSSCAAAPEAEVPESIPVYSETTDIEISSSDFSDAVNEGPSVIESTTDSTDEEIMRATAEDRAKAKEALLRTVHSLPTDTAPLPDRDLEKLTEQNPDIVGYIYQPGTPIDYPIMYRAGDDEYYLNHDENGMPDKNGSIFIEGAISPDFCDFNTTIHGHNMKSREMFGSLKDYLNDPGYYDKHPYFYIYTPDYIGTYSILSVYSESYLSGQYRNEFLSLDDYRSFLEEAKARSAFDTGVPINEALPLITLSTCHQSGEDGVKTVLVLQLSAWR